MNKTPQVYVFATTKPHVHEKKKYDVQSKTAVMALRTFGYYIENQNNDNNLTQVYFRYKQEKQLSNVTWHVIFDLRSMQDEYGRTFYIQL